LWRRAEGFHGKGDEASNEEDSEGVNEGVNEGVSEGVNEGVSEEASEEASEGLDNAFNEGSPRFARLGLQCSAFPASLPAMRPPRLRHSLLALTLALATALSAPASAATLTDQRYGPDAAQIADVYLPDAPHARAAPILVIVHGGSWKNGDKAAAEVVDNKLAHWLPQGYAIVSVNTRLMPQARPEAQAEDLGRAIAWITQQAPSWQADASNVIVMGHSSGGHLLALLAADDAMRQRTGAPLWRASVILDGAGFDLLDVMPRPHAPFYDEAFGTDPARWAVASPAAQLRSGQPPALFVCSTLRPDPCRRAQRYADLLTAQGGQAELVGVARNHAQINADVGADNDETRAISAFIDARLAR
jgi:acetyl esterase/lipase